MRITSSLLKNWGFGECDIKRFKKDFPFGEEYMDVLALWEKEGFGSLASKLMRITDFSLKPLILNKYLIENSKGRCIFYPGDIIFDGDVTCRKQIVAKGKITVHGRLIVEKSKVEAPSLQAESLITNGRIYTNKIKTKDIILNPEGHISGGIETKTFIHNGGFVYGHVNSEMFFCNSQAQNCYMEGDIASKYLSLRGLNLLGAVDTEDLYIYKGTRIHMHIKAKNVCIDGGETRGKIRTKTISITNKGYAFGDIETYQFVNSGGYALGAVTIKLKSLSLKGLSKIFKKLFGLKGL